jgi:hypothetical protein
MVYQSLDEIWNAKKSALQRIRRIVEHVTPAGVHFRPSDGSWTIAENLEHLSITGSQTVSLVEAMLRKTEEAGASNPGGALAISVQSYFERSQREKYRTREQFVPSGRVDGADSLQVLSGIEQQLLALGPRLEIVDLTYASFPHWIFGRLQLGQWLAFVVLHEERHCDQIVSIVDSPEFSAYRGRWPRENA